MNRILFAALAALALCGCSDTAENTPVAVDDPLSLISGDRILAHLEYLASDALEGREAGQPGYDMAAEYVAQQFAAMGLDPGGTEGFMQPVPLQSYQLDTDAVSLVVHRDSGDAALTYREDFAMYGDRVRPENTVRAEAVYVGNGVHAPEFGYSDFEGIDLEGKIAVVMSGAPESLAGEERAYYASSRTKGQELARRGAVGVIGVFSSHLRNTLPWERIGRSNGLKPGMTWVDVSGAPDGYFPEILGVSLLSPDAATEFFAGTPLSYEEALEAADASQPAAIPLGFEVTMSRKTTHEQLTSPNVIGIVRGSDPELAKEYIAFSAHLDHVGRGLEVDGDDIYNGMYDNALGVAVMIEAARALAASPPRRSVLFIALAAEEKGLLGSDYFANYPTVPSGSLVANVNMDMPLFIVPITKLVAYGAEHSSLDAVASEAAAAEGFTLVPDPIPEENIFIRSDQYSFVRKGVPAIYLDSTYDESEPDDGSKAAFEEHRRNHYHRPSDDLSRPLDMEAVVRFTRTNARIGRAIGNDDTRPTWNEGDFFGDMFAR